MKLIKKLGLCAGLTLTLCTFDTPITMAENASSSQDKIKSEYKAAYEKLTDKQKETIENIENKNIEAMEPLFAAINKTNIFEACSEIKGTYKAPHTKSLQNYKFNKYDEHFELRKALNTAIAQTDFIEPRLLNAHIHYKSAISLHLFTQLSPALKHAIVADKKTEECDKLSDTLKEYSDAGYIDSSSSFESRVKSMTAPGGKTLSCSIGFRENTKNGERVSTQLILMPAMGQPPALQFSTKIYDTSGTPIAVETTWLDFGSFNTRFAAQMSPPNKQLLIGHMNAGTLIPVLQNLQETKSAVISAKSPNWDKTYVYEVKNISADTVKKMANCASDLVPELSPALKSAKLL